MNQTNKESNNSHQNRKTPKKKKKEEKQNNVSDVHISASDNGETSSFLPPSPPPSLSVSSLLVSSPPSLSLFLPPPPLSLSPKKGNCNSVRPRKRTSRWLVWVGVLKPNIQPTSTTLTPFSCALCVQRTPCDTSISRVNTHHHHHRRRRRLSFSHRRTLPPPLSPTRLKPVVNSPQLRRVNVKALACMHRSSVSPAQVGVGLS